MTQPPQPRRSRALVDTANPNLSPYCSSASAALRCRSLIAFRLPLLRHLKDLDRIREVWPDWGKS